MDNPTSPLLERLHSTSNVNGSARRSSPIPTVHQQGGGRPASLMEPQTQTTLHVVRVVVNKDERGYGMKVSGDNPVYVQSVKEGGAAEKAGLHAGDKIIKVNGVNVMSCAHTEVVDLIKASSQVVLTVQQRSGTQQRAMGSPSLHNRPLNSPSSTRITGPQPVDHEKQYQLQLEKEQHYRLMIEKEQRYIDLLRSQIASSPDEKKCSELIKTERNLQTLQAMLMRSKNEQSPPSTEYPNNSPQSPSSLNRKQNKKRISCTSPNGNTIISSKGPSSPPPPPLPKRNHPRLTSTTTNNGQNLIDTNTLFINNEINANLRQGNVIVDVAEGDQVIDNPLYVDQPPPLPPRHPLSSSQSQSHSLATNESDAVNSINKQMSYPLVATCATLVNDYSPNNPTHHRTKSSPESLLALTTVDGINNKMCQSESMNDLSNQDGDWERTATPPGTPPPPYPSPPQSRRRPYQPENGDVVRDLLTGDNNLSSPDVSPLRARILANSSPIHAANPQMTQQPIISMEDDEISDQEMNHPEDHGPFKSLSRLWEHPPHLAVFMNYILSNSDPNSLLFYLLTDLYKEGNAKEMRKWAFEIHSCFLVPGAPLRLCNVDENIAREIDDVLIREYDKEEILRKIFWKARSRAKEELSKQLVDFQQKRTAGLGTIFGPTDQILLEIYNDKAKETKLYEDILLRKLEPYFEEFEKPNYDPKRYFTSAALTTVLTRVFGLRLATHNVDRCPTFVSKEKSFRTKFTGKFSRKLNVQGHQFVAQNYYTVIVCNNCHQIIYGIGPQGYQCSVCLINLHRLCVQLYDDTCPGPINKKDRGIGKFIRIRHENNEHRRKQNSHHFIQMEKERRLNEERDSSFEINESGENKPSQPVSRSGSDRRPDVVREEKSKCQENNTSFDHGHDKQENETTTPDNPTSFPSTNKKRASSNINRSESVKEQSEKRNKQKRNISDPSHNNTTSGDVDLDQAPLSNTDSGSSSNSSISYNGRLSESPSNSVDAVAATDGYKADKSNSDWESDTEMEPINWQKLFPEEELRNLQPHEKKRQDVINELFHTESTHVRNLRVLYEIFYKTLLENQVLKQDELSLIFPNIKETLNVHTQLNREMKRKRREDKLVGDLGNMLMGMFGGGNGESLQKAAAQFCERQQLALEFIKERRKRDSKFDAVLVECEKKRQCRRLPFQGIIPTEMQRLSKYPLLLERLISSVEANALISEKAQEELVKLRKAHSYSKEILNYVNEAAKLALNRARLEDIQKHLDTTNFERYDLQIVQDFKNLDLTRYKLVTEGNMQLRRPGKAIIPVHILLLEEAVVILHKEGDKFLLKFFQSGTPAQPQPLSPIIKMSTLLVRTNAVCKNALFLVNTSTNNSQMYDLLAEDDAKREVWFKYFSDAADAHNRREGNREPPPPDSDESETLQDIPSTKDVCERAEAVGGGLEENHQPENCSEDDEQQFSDAQDGSAGKISKEPSIDSTEGGGTQRKVTADDWPLIQPSQVHVEMPPVHTAESRLTSLEQIRRKDEEVRRALEDKEGLVADLLSIPREHYQHIADMAGEVQSNSSDSITSKDLSERVLAAVYQVDQLQLTVNEALNVTDSVLVQATGGKYPVCQSQEITQINHQTTPPPSIAAHRVRDIANLLSSQLTTLLSEVKQAEEERDRLRKEVYRLREGLHEQHLLHGPILDEDASPTPPPPPESQSDLESIKECPTETES